MFEKDVCLFQTIFKYIFYLNFGSKLLFKKKRIFCFIYEGFEEGPLRLAMKMVCTSSQDALFIIMNLVNLFFGVHFGFVLFFFLNLEISDT